MTTPASSFQAFYAAAWSRLIGQVAHGGLVFSAPKGWAAGVAGPCLGLEQPEMAVAMLTDPPPALGKEIRKSIACPARHPFAVLRSLPDAELPGGTERTVNGMKVLVNTGPPGWGANNQVPASWSIHHAVFRATQDGAGLLLEVVAPSATSQALFERILTSVRPGQQAGAPGTKRIAYGGVAFGVPRAWRVVREHDDPCASGTEAVFLGVDLDKARCTLPRSYLDVTRSEAPTGPLVQLNGFGLQYGSSAHPESAVASSRSPIAAWSPSPPAGASAETVGWWRSIARARTASPTATTAAMAELSCIPLTKASRAVWMTAAPSRSGSSPATSTALPSVSRAIAAAPSGTAAGRRSATSAR